jgi:thiol-disulfide isomerase/thioredoxin
VRTIPATLAALCLVVGSAAADAPDPEGRIVAYLKEHTGPGEAVRVSDLYNSVFTSPAERKVLDRLFDDFFKIPLFVVDFQRSKGRAPTLVEISEQFDFRVPGEASVLLSIMESDPRVPNFLKRDPRTGEIASVDVAAVKADPRFGRALDRTIGGFEGRLAPPFSVKRFDGTTIGSDALAGRPYILYFWFSNCPPCMRTAPLLAAVDAAHRAQGLTILGVNADQVLEIPVDDAARAAYARKEGLHFPLAYLSEEMQDAYGMVSVFPTLVFVDRKGVIVKELVSMPTPASLDAAVRLVLTGASAGAEPKPKATPAGPSSPARSRSYTP